MISSFSSPCFQSLDQIAVELGLPKVHDRLRCNILKPSPKGKRGDFVLTFVHPLLISWHKHISEVSDLLLKKFNPQEYPLQDVIIEEGPFSGSYLILYLNRSKCAPLILSQTSEFLITKRQCSFCDAVLFIRPGVVSSWKDRCVETWAHSISRLSCCPIGVIEDEVLHQPDDLQSILPPQSTPGKSGVIQVNVSSVLGLVNPKYSKSVIDVSDSKLNLALNMKEAMSRHSFPDVTRIILVTEKSRLKDTQEAALILALTHVFPCCLTVLTASQISSDSDFNEHSSWLKNYIIAQSFTEESEDETSLQLPNVDESLIQRLFETCIRTNFLSTSKDKVSKVDTDQSLKAIFVQYNVARLSLLQMKFQEQQTDDGEDLDLSVLTHDGEWKLIVHYVSSFECLLTKVAGDQEFNFRLLINFMNNLSRDLSSYYRKVRILVHDVAHGRSLVRARIHLITVVREILVECLRILGVEPVEKM